MAITHDPRLPRDLHPGAWWLWALCLATAAGRTDNPVLLILIALVVWFVIAVKRTDAPWARAYGLFVRIALVVLALRVVLQAILSTNTQGAHVLVVLPEIPLPDWVVGIKLGGVITWEAVLTSLYSGGQLAVMLICFGAANALASPRRLLRLLPTALYEVQVAMVVALTFAPQLVDDARRVRNARRLRGRTVRIRDIFRTTAMPVLESALDRSIDLAASMDARGFGRNRHLSRGRRRLTSGLSLAGAMGLLIGTYGLVSASIAPPVAIVVAVGGSTLAVAALVLGRSRSGRSRYRPDPWALPEWLVAASGAVTAGVFVGLGMAATNGPTTPLLQAAASGLTMPTAIAVPPLPLIPLVAVLVAALPALVAPEPAPAVAPGGPAPALTPVGTPARTGRPEEVPLR